ncbi:hypothetical protein [Fibrobacter sp. HC4]|uniref:exodeoxyribonuclease X C-terminal domain-containing protein n=1 Tax=Fibrobacter sp. HC4 TaxID=3239812 RepID=UPI0020190E7F|nr:hypothetical protein [Fibrobacter succinogenes]
MDEVMEERNKSIKPLHPEDELTYGKYKGQSIKEIAGFDINYLRWLAMNNEDFVFDFKELS